MAKRTKGWRNKNKTGNSPKFESRRHSLASQGIKTAKQSVKASQFRPANVSAEKKKKADVMRMLMSQVGNKELVDDVMAGEYQEKALRKKGS